MLRTLIHYSRVHLAVVAGAAVATAVLAGALLVGDSVRGSLRDLTLDRLGAVDSALTAGRFFRMELAGQIAGLDGVAHSVPAIQVRGALSHAASGARASQVALYGIEPGFAALFGEATEIPLDRTPDQIFPSIVINESLRRELGAKVGDALLVRFGRPGDVPRETLMGDKDADSVLGTLRLAVRAVLPDAGPGRFGLVPSQQQPLNAFVSMRRLQRELGVGAKANAVLVAHPDTETLADASLAPTVTLGDLGLKLDAGDGFVSLTGDEFVLRPDVDRIAGEVAETLAVPVMRVQSYLANELRVGQRATPYSLVAGLDPQPGLPWAELRLQGGAPAPVPSADGILLNAWTAEDLAAAPGDTLEMSYFVVGAGESLREERTTLRVEGIVALRGLGADRGLTPDYPGIREARDIASWDPPFPVDLSRVRDKDEAYWDDHEATPKAFVSEATGKRLWTTRFGTTTSMRIGLPPGESAAAFRDRLEQRLREALDPAAFGFRFLAVKSRGLRAASGATDFSGLFVAFSFFLIVSAAMLAGLLFRLGVEQRAPEIGLLLAVGHRVRSVRRRLLGEGAVLAGLGVLVGLPVAVGYAGLMMIGLRTLWRPAVGSSELYLHVQPATLAVGGVASLAVVLVSVAWSLRRLVRLPPQRLLAGDLTSPGKTGPARLARALAWGGLMLAAALSATAVATGNLEHPGLAFGTAGMLLVSGLGFFTVWCRGSRRRGLVGRAAGLAGMAARNSSWNPGRSVLSVALVAFACFVIVAVAASREELSGSLGDRSSGTGGFALVAAADVPLLQDLGDRHARSGLGFPEPTGDLLDGVATYAFRLLPGDDASCLNLYVPDKPRVLGAPDAFLDRGGFTFQAHAELPEGATTPWDLLRRPIEPGVIPAVADANSAQWILKVGLGQDVELRDELGATVRLRLVGLLQGSMIRSELIVSEADLLRHFPSREGHQWFLIDAPRDRADEVAQILESTLEPFGFDVTSAPERLASYMVVQNTYLSTFQLLGGLGLLLGTLGLAVVLVRNVFERRGELATLRAFGFRRSRLAWLVLAENAFLLVTGMAIGTLAALAAVAPRLSRVDVSWPTLGGTLLIVLAVGLLASVAAVAGALRVPLLPELKTER